MRDFREKLEAWSVDQASELYHISRWGANYFGVNDEGHVAAYPLQEAGASVDLMDIVEEAKSRGLKFPILIRFQDILKHRVESINRAFQKSIKECEYKNTYRGVFPIKVNQLREVVEEILEAGKPYDMGLEVGSKPELFAAMSLQDSPNSLMICNGYKDSGFIHMALMGIKLNKRVILVVEKMEELKQIIAVSRKVGVEPLIGIRARLLSKGAGKWAKSAGENAKFGLSTSELVAATELLKKEKLEHCFKLLHFHIGSQVPDILTFKKATQEAGRLYAKLYKLGFNIETVDVGGGLGVDYDGSRTAFESSTNYTLQEYANDIVYYLGNVCDTEEVPHPQITSESGRAIVAHHSVLLVEVLGSIKKGTPADHLVYGDDEHPLVKELIEMRDNLTKLNRLEAYHDALERKDDAYNMFTLGLLELVDKAKIETLFWEIGRGVLESYRGKVHVPEEIRQLKDQLADQYLCNFSVFQSLLDHWALDQLFPIMPVNKLKDAPEREGTLVDITCDSDGKVDRFIDFEDTLNTLPLHDVKTDETGRMVDDYYLGFFLMGAYQDIMGDLHNLFGRVNEVHVFLDEDEPCGHYIEEVIEGTTVGLALSSVQYDQRELKRHMKRQVDRAIKEDQMKPREGMRLLRDYDQGLSDYTYLGS
ncbi:MAG: biosynthetic arginine decarboxylase [Verrucomicrobia bacterium]|jgi:arginine decarboxylase|nr:biosynthetic arginine decarboxylase [Verrucomicrobiota bacterium]